MYIWTFALNGEPIPNGWEPIGWDKVKFTLRRAIGDIGYDFTFSDTLQFDGRPKQILYAAYQEAFIDAYVTITITHCLGWTYSGVINFTLYKEENGYITAGIKESGYSNLFTTRYDTPVDLSRLLSIDGNPLTALSPIDLPLHSKLIVYTAHYEINPLLAVQAYTPPVPLALELAFPLQIQYSDVEESLEPSSQDVATNPLLYTGFTYPAGKTIRTIRIYGRLKFSATVEDDFAVMSVHLVAQTVQTPTVVYDIELYLNGSYSNGQTVDIVIDETLDLPADCNVFLFSNSFENPSAGSDIHDQTFTFDTALSQLNFTEESLFPTSTTKAYLIYEAMNRIVESITGVENAIVSDFLGRTDSVPTAYPADGTGALIALTNGFNIRKFEDKPVVTSFKQLFDGLNAIHNIGFRVEGQKIRIEPKQYFYQLEAKARFSFVKDISESVSLPDIYSEIEFEYQNQGDSKQINKLDEFNTKRNYVTPIRQHKQKLLINTDVITSGYALEFTRREQFSTSPTKDYPTDNNPFFIALARSGIDFIPEKDENYTPVTNLISPTTAYNLRFAPVRCLYRWQKIFSGCLFRSFDKVIKFQTGTGNYLMQAGGITENENMTADFENALFIPIEVSFEYPLTFGEFLLLRDFSIYSIEYSCSRTDYQKTFIREVSYEPNREGGVAHFKLIQANADRNESLADV